ncbi:hypothetical protein AA19596_1833 [Acetobacter fabarum DSM 19596]|nr:hypothetical protein AA19596_1833 [Acetobacter fabarum DSM 19596]
MGAFSFVQTSGGRVCQFRASVTQVNICYRVTPVTKDCQPPVLAYAPREAAHCPRPTCPNRNGKDKKGA